MAMATIKLDATPMKAAAATCAVPESCDDAATVMTAIATQATTRRGALPPLALLDVNMPAYVIAVTSSRPA